MTMVTKLIQKCFNENAHTKLGQEKYRKRYEGLISRFKAVKIRHNEISGLKQVIKVRREKVELSYNRLRNRTG